MQSERAGRSQKRPSSSLASQERSSSSPKRRSVPDPSGRNIPEHRRTDVPRVDRSQERSAQHPLRSVSDRPRVPGDPARNTAATQRTGTISGVQQEVSYSSARNIAEQQRSLRTALDAPIELIPYHTGCSSKSDSPALVHRLSRRRECVIGCLLHGSKAAHTTSECAAVARLLRQADSASKRVQTDPWRPTPVVAPAVVLKPKSVDIGIQDDLRFHVGSARLAGRSDSVPLVTPLSSEPGCHKQHPWQRHLDCHQSSEVRSCGAVEAAPSYRRHLRPPTSVAWVRGELHRRLSLCP